MLLFRSYEDINQVDDGTTPATGTGDIRHLQKERVSLLEQLEDCTSSGEEGSGRRRCNKHRRSASGEGSRPGTPLCDERPENLGPVEPRRPRDSRPHDPLSLPLPRFASQVLSPRPAPPSPPASPLTHSSSSDSEPSPEWEERLRSLDEKYEKWSGSRAGLTKIDPSTLKVRHKLLDLDLHELQPSEIVKSVLAKRSVFDEDSKRLENFGEKYEPREFVPARSSLLRARIDLSPMSSPVNKSPSSPAAKGLQYPFPSHPPVQPTSVATTTGPSGSTVTVATTEVKPPATTFLTNCNPARQFPLPKISSPQAEKCDASPRTATTKALPTPTPVVKSVVPLCSKPVQEVKKEPIAIHTKAKNNLPLRRESTDEKKEEGRRKSRDESIDTDSVKREDISESDKVKETHTLERRKSVSEKRRNSCDIKDSCERSKDIHDRRRGSAETESDTPKKSERKLFDENHLDIPKPVSEVEKVKKISNDCTERRKDTEINVWHNSELDKKKDVLGVNSEKDKRRNKENSELFDNLKHKKVPENKKEFDSTDKRDEEIKVTDVDRLKETSESCNSQHLNRHKDKKDHLDRRRDSSDHPDKKLERTSSENAEIHRIKEKKSSHDLIESRNSKKHHDDGELKCDNAKHKDSERRKNSETEISKEHSLFKKVFGFAERTYGHKDRRDSDSTAVKTDDNIKVKRDHSEKERKKDKDSDHSESSSKHRSRKSPDQPENNRHKERKHSESSEKKSKKDIDPSDDHKQKDDHSDNIHKSHRKEDRSKESVKNVYSVDQEYSSSMGKQDRRKETSLDDSRNSETDSNDLKIKDGECKKDSEVFFERRKEENSENRNKDERRRDSEKYFNSEKYNNDRIKKDDHDTYKDLDKKNDSSELVKFKHDRHRENEKKKDFSNENCRTKEQRDDHRLENVKHKDDRKCEDMFDSLKSSKDDNFRFREFSRKKESETQDHIRIKDIIDSKKKDEKEKKKDRESQEFSFKKARDSEEKNRDSDKIKRKKDFDINEPKLNGDHDDYLDNIDCRKPNYEEEVRIDPIKKDKKRDKNNTWPATIGCKRRLSSQDSLDIVEEAKKSKPERRDSKDSGRSSGSSRKGSSEKHKGFTKLLEEKIKEDKEQEQRKKEELLLDSFEKLEDKAIKPAAVVRKEKRNSGEKRKEERKFKNRPRENGTASESDMASGDDETKVRDSNKRQHSIFDIVVDEPAYISMYDKVKARSTKNMQKLEEEKRQEKLKEKFHQLKASRAKREEKKRSTSYDEDSDSEKGSSRRSNKLLITSSEDDACSESDVRFRSRKILCDTSEDDTIIASRTHVSKFSEYESKSSRKIISDVSEDDSAIKHSTPKVKSSRNISFESEMKSRKIMSDTSEDDSTRHNIQRLKPTRINSEDSEGDLGFEDTIRTETSIISSKPSFIEPTLKITDVFASRPVEMNHFTSTEHDQKPLQIQSSPESLRRISLDSATSEQPRKKSHKKKQKKKNYEVAEDGTIIIRKHSSKKDKKKSHRDNDDEEKKSRKKKSERDCSSNKRDEKFEDIFGPLSDDSEKVVISKWQVSQVYGSDSESERENIRKKEKKRREKKQRELDEAGRALEAKLLDSSEDITEEHVKIKKKKRKKSRDEKIKHHRISEDGSAPPTFPKDIKSPVENTDTREIKTPDRKTKLESDNEREDEDDDDDSKIIIGYDDHIRKAGSVVRQHTSSLSSLLDSPPPQTLQQKKPDIPGFGSQVDENIHETAVKSISETTLGEHSSVTQEKFEEKPKQEEQTPPEDKPTPVISQEETEDAVAALLMEDTFGSISGFERYSEDTPKPGTPVSEPDLQIDTDTEDNFDQVEFSKPSRDTDEDTVPFYQQNDTREGLEERILPLACSAESPSNLEAEKKVESDVSLDGLKEGPISIKVDDSSSLEENSQMEENSLEKPLPDQQNESDSKNIVKPLKTEKSDVKESGTCISDNNSSGLRNDLGLLKMSSSAEPDTIKDIKEKSKDSVIEEQDMKMKVEPQNEIQDPTERKETIPIPEVLVSQPEVIQQNISKTVSLDKINEPKSPIVASSQPPVIQKSEKVVHHQNASVSHTTVLVNQTLQKPQTAQVVKPLTIQVLNHPPALKPLEQPTVQKSNAGPPVSVKVNSPPIVLSPPSLSPSFQPKPQPSSQASVPKPPLHHGTSFHGLKLPSPITHLVPPHLPVKPATQISLQTPQLTPISKGNIVVPPRPLVVHTIQNHTPQKQLHVVTSSSQLSPQPPNQQNLKVIRPGSGQPVTIIPPQPLNRQPPPQVPASPLLQTVPITEASLNKQFNMKTPVQILNQDNIHSHPVLSTNQIPLPDKIMNLSPVQNTSVVVHPMKPAGPLNVKTNDMKQFSHDNNVDPQNLSNETNKKGVIRPEALSPKPVITPLNTSSKPPVPMKIEETSNESSQSFTKVNDEMLKIHQSLFEPKLIKPNYEEPKPLNAVIQDLTIRAANKASLGKPANICSNTSETKSETPKPIEQVVRELQLRKRAASLSSEVELPPSPKTEVLMKCDQNLLKSEPVKKEAIVGESKINENIKVEPDKNDSIKTEHVKSEIVKTEPIKNDSINTENLKNETKNTELTNEEARPETSRTENPKPDSKIPNETHNEEIKQDEKPLEEVQKIPDESISEKNGLLDTPLTSNKIEPKATLESLSPQNLKESEPEIPSSEERGIFIFYLYHIILNI